MAIANIFKCVRNEVEIIPDSILAELNISYEESNRKASNIAILSKTLKEHKNKGYCRLPFCHTLEAESFGSTVIFNQRVGNRIGKYKIIDINSVEDISRIDLSSGRISEVLKAVNILKEEGETVILDVSGPISIATSIMDSQLFYKSVRKNRGKINKLLEVIEDSIVAFILEGIKQGADIISFADPTGTIDIVGPKVYEEISGKSTYNILKKIENRLGGTIVHLCGKTSTSLESIELLKSEKIKIEGKNYLEMIENIREKRKDIKFIGHWCLKLDRNNNEVIGCMIK